MKRAAWRTYMAVLLVGVLALTLVAMQISTPAQAQTQRTIQKAQMTWAKTYGGKNNDSAFRVAVDGQGNIIVVGETWSFGAGGSDVWVLKLDPNGDPTWQKAYGGTYGDSAFRVAVDGQGNIIVVGETWSFGAGGSDVWVLKLNASGNVIWQKGYGRESNDYAWGVAVDSQGNIIVAGGTESFGAGGSDVWILKLDPNGDPTWQKTYGGASNECALDVAFDVQGNIIVSGYTYSFGAGGSDVWVLKLDPNGEPIWQKTYGGVNDDYASGVTVDAQGNIIVAGGTSSSGAGGWNVWVLKLNSSGDTIWQKTYGEAETDVAYDVTVNAQGNIIVSGYTYSFGAKEKDIWVLKLDPNGNPIWQKTYGGTYEDWAMGVAADNEGIIVAGFTSSFGAGLRDLWVLRISSNGEIYNSISEFTIKNTNVAPTTTAVSPSPTNAAISSTNANLNDTQAIITNTNAAINTQAPPSPSSPPIEEQFLLLLLVLGLYDSVENASRSSVVSIGFFIILFGDISLYVFLYRRWRLA
ncbi:MAG: hypothetical protein QXW47_11175 [Candidatus Jordarchaeales archaeon]